MNRYLVKDLIDLVPDRTLFTLLAGVTWLSFFQHSYHWVCEKIRMMAKDLPPGGTQKFLWHQTLTNSLDDHNGQVVREKLYSTWVMCDWEWVKQDESVCLSRHEISK